MAEIKHQKHIHQKNHLQNIDHLQNIIRHVIHLIQEEVVHEVEVVKNVEI